MIKVHIIPILQDNYAYAIESDDAVAVIDPGEASGVIAYLDAHGLRPTQIWNTHHHWDHVNGNVALSQHYGGLQIFNTANPPPKTFGRERVEILETPGHTLDHICFYFPESSLVFTADTLFCMGCGRLFEGSAEQMWESLQKLAALPDKTKVYCGHEYTLANGGFCMKIEPNNHALHARIETTKRLRNQNLPSVPSTIMLEKETNAFLRAGSAARFAEIRTLKNQD